MGNGHSTNGQVRGAREGRLANALIGSANAMSPDLQVDPAIWAGVEDLKRLADKSLTSKVVMSGRIKQIRDLGNMHNEPSA